MPSFERVFIDPAKFANYSLDPENPHNRGKWQAFQQLGYDVHSEAGRQAGAQNLIQQIEEKLTSTSIEKLNVATFGERYRAEVIINGLNGLTATLVTVWQVDEDSVMSHA